MAEATASTMAEPVRSAGELSSKPQIPNLPPDSLFVAIPAPDMKAGYTLTLNPDNRLSLPYPVRLPLAMGSAFFIGSILGGAHSAQMTSLRFRAENAHRLPRSQKGWYFYQKSKNYKVMLEAIKSGVRGGTKLAVWVGGFLVVEESLDRLRGQRDFISTVVAGWGISGVWSLWNRFPVSEAARTAKLGLVVGLGFGLMQDALALLRGRKVNYVEFTKALWNRWDRFAPKQG